MSIRSTRKPVALVLATSLGLVAACGGGGGGGDDDSEEFDHEATGVWRGTLTPDGEAAESVLVVVANDGRFVAAGDSIYLSGTGTMSGDRLTANATGYAATGTTFASGSATGSFSLTGFLFEENRSESSYSGAGESGKVVMNYDAALSNRPSSLSAVAGNYVTSAGGALAFTSSGAVTLNSPQGPNRIGNGTITAGDAARNVYTWVMTLSGCTAGNGDADGVAFLQDLAGQTNNLLVAMGDAGSVPVVVLAQK